MIFFDSFFGKRKKKNPKNNDEKLIIFHQKNTKNITLTYHKFPKNLDLSKEAEKFKQEISGNLSKTKGKYQLVHLTLMKEPYDLNKNPENEDLCHIHGLVEIDRKIRIHNHKHLANLFILKYEDKEYYPHLSPCKDKQAYLDYIQKLHDRTAVFCPSEDRYSSHPIKLLEQKIGDSIEMMAANMGSFTKQDVRVILEKIDIDEQLAHRKKIDYIFSKLPETREKVEDYLLDKEGLKYKAQHYKGNPNFVKIKDAIEYMIAQPRKQSLYIKGKHNTGKSSMVGAVVQLIEEEKGMKILVLIFNLLDDVRVINKIAHKEYDHIILVFDDSDICEKEEYTKRSFLLSLFSGNENPSTLSCRYFNAKFTKNMTKVFISNISFKDLIEEMKEEYKARIKEITLDDLFNYES